MQPFTVPSARPTSRGTANPSILARLRRLLAALVRVVVVIVVVVVAAISWIGSERAIHPAIEAYHWTPAAYPSLVPQDISFLGTGGARLVGRFFPGRTHATIVVSHGYGGNQNGVLPWAVFLHQAGYSVLTYDMRGAGRSGGGAVTLGALEQFDLVAAVDYLVSRPDVDKTRIGALGISLGGAVTILGAARDRRIRAAVDDCGFSDAPRVIDASFTHFIGLPAFPFSPLAVRLAELRTGQQIDTVRPVDMIASISPRPILIIHGLADSVVPVDNSRRNFAAARQPKELWLVPGAGHGESRAIAGAAYTHRVVAFFRQALGS